MARAFKNIAMALISPYDIYNRSFGLKDMAVLTFDAWRGYDGHRRIAQMDESQ